MTMDRYIKSSAITFGGYLYQNLIGLEVLCNWLNDPELYKWVKFEADDDEIPKGLDDVIAQRSDGSLVLLQVKFTVNPTDEENYLSWDWLLKHKPKGRSLLQKWSNAFFAAEDKVAETALLTNRHPSRDFFACLNESSRLVDLALVPPDTKSILIEQLGSEAKAIQFFRSFEFRHSHQGYLALRRALLDRYVPRFTTYHGWNVLYLQAIDWAVRKNFPFPDGRITLELLRGILDSRRPEPISQSFHIPEGYIPPDEIFSNELIKSLATKERNLVILWGSPGQGKSTFLSYICTRLVKLEVPFVRHHYFLDLADTSDRFSFPTVANSLMAQMEAQHIEHIQGLRNNPENLREWFLSCARGYAAKNKVFIVIVDGLDHVWRENERNRQPLESLFRHIFPIPDNVTLIIGTQRVDNDQLPSLFSKFVTENDWVELPRMSLTVTKVWLKNQLDANRFELPDRTLPFDRDPLTQLAESFHRISGGHPLHLIYSFEAVVHEQRVLTSDTIDSLPACPEGDIKKYYRNLWSGLSFLAKDALHLVADAEFIWPPMGLEDCLNANFSLLRKEIGHLFYTTDAGQVPFHGSLLAFIREDAEHKERINHLLPSIVAWLEVKAPEYHRWGWLWLFRARMGQLDDIINLPNRTWIIDSLAKAYPEGQINEILSMAERLAFESRRFARAVRLRWLKTRLLNGMEFQLTDYDRLYACALTLSDDDYPLRNLSANFLSASIDELYLLGKQYQVLGKMANVAECQEQIRRRINDRIKAHAYDNNQELEEMSKRYLELTAATKDYEPDKLLKSIRGFRDLSPSLFRFFIRELSKHHDLRLLIDFLPHPLPRGMRRDLELALVRLSGACRAKVHEWPEFDRLRKHPIVGCWALLYAHDKARDIPFAITVPHLDVKVHPQFQSKESVENYLHGLFFHSLSKCLELHGADPIISLYEFGERSWLNIAVKNVVTFATSVGKLLVRGNWPGFGHGYRLMREVKIPEDYNAAEDYVAFRRALLSISTDLFLLTSLRSNLYEIPLPEWRLVTESEHFQFSEWLERYREYGFKIVSGEAIREELQNRLDKETKRISPFNERAGNYLELCDLAIFQQLESLGNIFLDKTLGCVMSYGGHRDATIFSVLRAIAALVPTDPEFARDLVSRVCPAIAQIGLITDGDDTNYAKFEMAELLIKLMPRSYAEYYEYLMRMSEWYEAEEVLSRLFREEPLNSPLMPFLMKVIWNSASVGALRNRAQKGDMAAGAVIAENAKFFGHPSEDFGKERFQNSAPITEEYSIDISKYEPDSLPAMLDDLHAMKVYVGERKTVRDWFEYWEKNHRGAELLRVLEHYLDHESIPSGVTEVLDDAFELSLTLEGKQKAYRWIVAAQIHRQGWVRYHDLEEALKRFATFAEHYASQWQDFILRTSRPAYHTASGNLVIPNDRLVQFLIAVAQVQVAKEVAEQMVSAVVDEVSDQPLETPTWLSRGGDKINAVLLAGIGLSRLRLPIPTAKFAVVYAAAEALQSSGQGDALWEALLERVSGLALESEVLEALCIPVLAKFANHVDVGALQRVIARPSPLSDLFLGEISGRPLLVNSWAKSHSGEAPPLFSSDDVLTEFASGRLIPNILVTRLRLLEKNSGHLFLKQWAYEYQRLVDRGLGEESGSWEYFIEGERGRSTGQVVTRRGQLARSAYLRTLSLAFDLWGMPEEFAYRESMYATPADFTFLRMLPGDPPPWVHMLSAGSPVSQEEWQRLLHNTVQTAIEDNDSELLHLNMPLSSTATFKAEIELISCLYGDNKPDPKEVFNVHRFLPGNYELPRASNWDIIVTSRYPDASFPSKGSGQIFPSLLPCVARYVGYFHSDLIGRIPYLPANFFGSADLIARPRRGGMDIFQANRPVGEIRYWNWRWSPTHDKSLGPNCGVSLTMSKECCKELFAVRDTIFTRYWRATVMTRDKEYGSWEEKQLVGELT
jgi:hypothetical protein